MAFKDLLLAARESQLGTPTGAETRPGALDTIERAGGALSRDIGAINAAAATSASPPPAAAALAPAKIAYSPNERAFIVNGRKVGFDGATLRALANIDEAQLGDMDTSRLPQGFVPISKADVAGLFERVRSNMESSPGALLWANAKSGAGGAVTAIPRALGFDVRNPLADSEQEAYRGMSLREQVGADESTFDSLTGFINDASRGVGSAAPAIAGAGAAALLTGGAALPAYLTGGAISAGSAFSSQSETAQDRLLSDLMRVPEQDLYTQSPEYASARASGLSHEQAVEELAFDAGRVAGGYAALTTLPETLIAGGLLRRIPGLGGVVRGGENMGAALRGVLPTRMTTGIGGVATRALGAGVGEGAQEVIESEASQQGASRYAGFDPKLGTYVDPRDFTAGMATGMVFGGLSRGAGNDRAALAEQALRENPMAAAMGDLDIGNQTAMTPDDTRAGAPDLYAPVRDLSRQAAQADNALRTAYGDDWANRAQQIAQDPEGSQLLGAYMGAMRDREAMHRQITSGLQPAPAAPAGQPMGLVGPNFGDVPGQQMALPGIGAPQPGGMPAASPEAAAMGAAPQQMTFLDEVGPQQASQLIARALQAGDTDMVSDLIEEGAITPETVGMTAQVMGVNPELLMQRLQQMGAGMAGPGAGQTAQEPAGAPAAPNLVERRLGQQARQQAAQAASEANPQALPPSDLQTVQDNITNLQAEIDRRTAASAAFPKTAMGRRFTAEMKRLQAQLAEVNATQPRTQIQTDEPLGTAPDGERMPDGRPVGVTPSPLANPEPMSPGEAAARAQTQAERAGQAPVGENARALAARGTQEPAGDIAAQVGELTNPQSTTDVVFIADGDPTIAALQADPPEGVTAIYKRGHGLFLVADDKPEGTIKAAAIRRRKPTEFDDRVMATLLQMPQAKDEMLAESAATGAAPQAVQAVKNGAVAAEAGAAPSKVNETVARIKAKAPGAQVRVVPAEAAQARRQNLTATVTPPARAEPQRPTTLPKEDLDRLAERLAQGMDSGETGLRDARAEVMDEIEGDFDNPRAQYVKVLARAREILAEQAATRNRGRGKAAAPAKAAESEPPAAARAKGRAREAESKPSSKGRSRKASNDDERRAPLDLRSKAGIEAGTLSAKRGEAVRVPETLATVTGRNDGALNLEVQSPNFALGRTLQNAIDSGRLEPESEARAKRAVASLTQLRTMLDASIDAARDRLLSRFEEEGHTPEQGGHLADEPLSPGEMSDFADMVQAQAKHELDQIRDGTWSQKSSLFRRAAGVLMPDVAARMNEETATRSMLKAVNEVDPAVMYDLAKEHAPNLRNNLLAKQAVRGASEVTGSTLRGPVSAESDAMGYLEPIETEDRELSHLTASKGIDDGLANVLNGWLKMFEKETSSRVRDVTLMTMEEAKQRYPGQVGEHARASGMTFPIVRYGKGRGTVIAIDNLRLTPGMQIETLGHELGHVVGDFALRNADAATQKAVIDAYHQWAAANGNRTSSEVWASRAPAMMASEMRPSGMPMDYAMSFREWLADNIARWMVTDEQPKSVVEKFFSTVAMFLKRVYQQIANKHPEVSVESLMRGYVNSAKATSGFERLDPWAGLSAKDRGFLQRQVGDGLSGRTTPERMNEQNYVERATEKLASLRDGIAPLIDPAAHKDARAEIAGRLSQTRGGDLFRRAVGMVTQGAQLADLYSNTPVGAPLRKVVRTRDKIGALARKLQEQTNRAHEMARTLSGDAREQLNSVMKDATMWNMHPDVPFDDKRNAHLTVKNPRVTDANRRRYNDLRARWDRMARTQWGATEAYAALRDSLRDLRVKTLEQQIENLTDLKGKRKTKASKAIIDKQIDELQQALDRVDNGGPYFPLMRNGRYIVSAQLPSESYGQDGETIAEGGKVFTSESAAEKAKSEYMVRTPGARISVEPVPEENGWMLRVMPRAVYMFDTEAQARKALPRIEEEIRKEYEYADGPTGFDRANEILKGGLISEVKVKDDTFERAKRNTDPRFWSEMETILDEAEATPAVREAYQQLYLESLPEFSHRKSMLQRERVLGAGDDMLLSHAHRSRGAAHSLADITHGRELSDAMTDLKEADPIVGRDLANSLQKGEDLARARQRRTWGNNVMNAITSANAAFSLSLSPGYVLANSAQPLAVSLPVLAGLRKGNGTVGLTKAARHLADAYKQVGTFFIGRGAEDFRNELKRMQGKETKGSDVDYATNLLDRMSNGNEELRGVLEELLDRGRLDFSFLDSMEDALKGGYTKWGAIQRLGMAFPQQVEAMNRVVTAIAAYNTAKQDMGVTSDTNGALTDFVDSLVRRTQLDYTVANRPPLFNVPGLNVALQFKMYLQGMYMLFVDAGRKALRGATAEEQREGRATLAYLMMTHGAIGGVAGLGPIGALAGMAAKAVAGDDDEYKDPETVIRQAMQSYVGEDLGNAVMRGLPTLIGVDAADKLGLPSLWDSKYMGISPRDSSAEGLDKAMLYALGSPYANARRVWQGINEPTDKGLDALPAGMRAVARAARTGAQGIVDRDGDQFIPRDALTFADLTTQALGFQPSKVQRAYALRNEEKSVKGRIQTEREALVKAARNGDDVRAQIREFNAKVPPVFRITGATLAEAAQSKAERAAGQVRKDDAAVKDMVK